MPRRIALSMLLVAALVLSGCSTKTRTASAPAPRAAAGPVSVSPAASPANGSVPVGAVCANLRSVVAADIGPIGTAFGVLVGDVTAHDTAARKKAVAAATRVLRKLGDDIAATAATAEDSTVRTAATTAQQYVAALASDPAYLAGITTMPSIAAATSKLQTATAPIAAACQGS